MSEHDSSHALSTSPAVAAARQLLAVIYAFAVVRDGERHLVSQEDVPASTLLMLLPQLEATPKRALIAEGPGLLVYDNYRSARAAAQLLTTIAGHVALREVAPDDGGAEAEVWTAADGARYRAVPGGLVEIVKA